MKKAMIGLFVGFIGAFLLAGIILPDRGFSPMENRNLAQAPAFSTQRLFDGQFTADAESYVTDQFPLRDNWMALKADLELLSGRRENDGVYICGDTLIERIDEPNQERISANIRAVNKFVQAVDVPVYMTVLPTAYYVWSGKLPTGAPGADEAATLQRIERDVDADYFDTSATLLAHADESIFYRTDHHWTSLGAYYGASAAAAAMGIEPVPLSDYAPQVVANDFYGTLYSKAGVRAIPADSMDVYAPSDGITVTSLENGQAVESSLYDYDALTEKDKYAFYMGGNQPLAVINTGHEGGRLLLVRDSYADCEIPFLTAYFSEIHVADLRYYRDGLADYVAEQGIDAVLISYSIRNFTTDTNLHFLT